jgi:hypothetical protein
MRNPYTFIIFLDFDGVLHRGTSGTFRKLPLLDELLARHPQVGLVLSTNWRQAHDLEGLRDYFTPVSAARIIGVTPDLPVSRHGWRQREIEAWLAANRHVTGFVALDDSPDLFTGRWPHLLLTDGREGLTPEDIALLDERISASRPALGDPAQGAAALL